MRKLLVNAILSMAAIFMVDYSLVMVAGNSVNVDSVIADLQ